MTHNQTNPLETLTYEQLRAFLSNLPQTWYPDLICVMVHGAHAAKTFARNGASRLVRNEEDRIKDAEGEDTTRPCWSCLVNDHGVNGALKKLDKMKLLREHATDSCLICVAEDRTGD